MKRNALAEPARYKFLKKTLEMDSYLNDRDLVIQISNNDLKAFQLFYDKYWEPLFRHACSKLPSSAEAQYIIEDLFIRIWDNSIQFSPGIRVDVFLFTELKKAIIKHYGNTFLK